MIFCPHYDGILELASSSGGIYYRLFWRVFLGVLFVGQSYFLIEM